MSRTGWNLSIFLFFTAAIVAILSLAVRDEGSGEDRASNPCLDPLPWRVGAVDPRFGMTPDELREAIRAATGAWEHRTGRRLFRHDSSVGMPIHLVYDERQEELASIRGQREEALELAAAIDGMERDQERRIQLLEDRVQFHNSAVEQWNQRGGGTARERRRIERLRADLDELRREVNRAAIALRRAIDRYNRIVEAYEPMAARRVQAGSFEETIITRGDRQTRTAPRLSIYQFENRAELVLILSHELGHALGLTHVADPTALMYDEYAAGSTPAYPSLADADVAALIERCGVEAWDATEPDPG